MSEIKGCNTDLRLRTAVYRGGLTLAACQLVPYSSSVEQEDENKIEKFMNWHEGGEINYQLLP